MNIIKNNWNEKGSILKYYFSKLKVFCDSSFKMLAEIIHQMDVIESCYKAEFKAISATFGSTNEAFKKFVSEINAALKTFQAYSQEQEKELLKTADKIRFHQKFKMDFNQNIDIIKQFILDLKQMYLEYNDACFNKWNETRIYCQETTLKHKDLSDHLSLFQKEMLKYLDNLPQQNINTLEHSPLKDKTDNVENRIHQLLQIHKEIKGNLGEAITVQKKASDKEFIEIEKYTSLKKMEIEKHFDAFSKKFKANSGRLLDELGSIHQISSDNTENLKKDLDLLSSVSYFEAVFNKYLSTSSNILAKSERSFEIIPSVCKIEKDNLPDFEKLLLEEWEVTTSTPNIPEKKEFNALKEKEKLLNRIKSLAEQQLSQKPSISALDYEDKESKNTSSVSLPSLRSYSKASVVTEKTFPRFKQHKK